MNVVLIAYALTHLVAIEADQLGDSKMRPRPTALSKYGLSHKNVGCSAPTFSKHIEKVNYRSKRQQLLTTKTCRKGGKLGKGRRK